MVRTGQWYCSEAEIPLSGGFDKIVFGGPIEAFELINVGANTVEVFYTNSATQKIVEVVTLTRSGWVPTTKTKPTCLYVKGTAAQTYKLNVVPG